MNIKSDYLKIAWVKRFLLVTVLTVEARIVSPRNLQNKAGEEVESAQVEDTAVPQHGEEHRLQIQTLLGLHLAFTTY